MSSPRLRVQFETLFEYFDGKDSEVQLDDITDVLCCTRRNARMVLNKLEEENWIEWQPAAGRGKQSKLIFKQNRNDVSETLARRYLEDGKIGQALNVLDRDAAKLTQVIQNYLGVQYQEGEQVIRLPYYRPLSMLNPAKSMRRSEQHIARQVFSGLTRLDDNDQLQPDLAHSWQKVQDDHWRFFIRPGVRFHNGELLQTSHIVETLDSLESLNMFSHIKRVESPANCVVDVYLTRPDKYFPLALTESIAKVTLPVSLRGDDYDIRPIGTGPYRVEKNDDQQLILHAFDGYFGFRPLIDRVEVWVVDEAYSSMVYPSLSKPVMADRGDSDEVELDPGCTYLLLNRQKGIAKNPLWAEFLSNALNAADLFTHIPKETVIDLGVLHAYGLKPGWYDVKLAPPVCPQSSTKPVIKIAFQRQHPMFPTLAHAIEAVLKQYGVGVELFGYDMDPPHADDVDIWINPMGIANNRDDALVGWLMDYSFIEESSPLDEFDQWCTMVEQWRAGDYETFPARQLGKKLVHSNQLIPMFHCWLGVNKDQCGTLQNAKCNALGWFDFSQVWNKPDLS
ncbi:SgrR family transcriptional regulator [Vibrio sp. THAF190c]|jgi:SgrR family transcriptional regulator|uniref:SgrR family transcriptional regulator n=1 Tax=Vibrio sp. THAF190c TaxID=2587865 RepID=UPI001268779D|nr:SgrR family transcriptional regulator [Vibrio sp. THAF190c]QFT12715.1 HTH-type transcriptional regulator SgrR [Vibrio sp. THAF190c]